MQLCLLVILFLSNKGNCIENLDFVIYYDTGDRRAARPFHFTVMSKSALAINYD